MLPKEELDDETRDFILKVTNEFVNFNTVKKNNSESRRNDIKYNYLLMVCGPPKIS